MARVRSIKRFATFTGQLNMTPMIDIVFQLLVFFMVASHLAGADRDPMALPQPGHSQAKEKEFPDRLVINLFSDADGKIQKIKANADLVKDLPSLVDLLLRVGPSLEAGHGSIVLRADRHMQFSQVEKVLQAIADAGVSSVNIAAEQDSSGGGSKS
jgi:biopolymer transport protein ExbD